jgi:hypothetical protein
MSHSDTLVRLLVAGDLVAVHEQLERSGDSDEPGRHLVAALVAESPVPALERASRLARTTRDRQLVAIAAAHLAGEHDRAAALLRDHLIDHPDSLLAAWIASQHTANPQE